jgi:WhiB family redox-sensing transcriptional regulator
MPNRDWVAKANCLGIETSLFYPDRGSEKAHDAKNVCYGCAVREECLSYALKIGERYGIWGGTSERQRKKIRRSTRLEEESLEEHLA